MSDQTYPRITNAYFIPGKKVRIEFSTTRHFMAAQIRRGSHRLCFKLNASYCREHLPEAYNNSLVDIYLNTGEAKVYPKVSQNVEVAEAVKHIIDEYIEAGLVKDVVGREHLNSAASI